MRIVRTAWHGVRLEIIYSEDIKPVTINFYKKDAFTCKNCKTLSFNVFLLNIGDKNIVAARCTGYDCKTLHVLGIEKINQINEGVEMTNLTSDRSLTPEEKARLEKDFVYHSPSGDQPERYKIIREMAKDYAAKIMTLCPDSREKSFALTKLEEAVFWANASIARNE